LKPLDKDGSSILTLAAEFSNSKTFKYVLEKSGLKLSSLDGRRRNSLECAISGKNFENARFIMNHSEGKSLVDSLPENLLSESGYNACLYVYDKIRTEESELDLHLKESEMLVPTIQDRIKTWKFHHEKLRKFKKNGKNFNLTKSENIKIHDILQVEYKYIENSWIAFYNEFECVHPSFEMEESYEKVVSEIANADRIVMELPLEQHQSVVTDWKNVADKLKKMTHKAKQFFSDFGLQTPTEFFQIQT